MAIMKRNKQVEVKDISDSLQRLRKVFSAFVSEFQEELAAVDATLAGIGGPETETHKSLGFLKKIHDKGGMTTNEDLAKLADDHDYVRYGSFFKGKRASLAKVHSQGKEVVALTQYGIEKLVRAGLIAE